MSKNSGGTKTITSGSISYDVPVNNITTVSVHSKTLSQMAAKYIEMGIDDIIKETHNFSKAVVVSNVPKEILEFAREHNIELGRHKIYMNGDQVKHTYRDNKHKEIALQPLIDFPKNMRSMDIYYDKSEKHKNFVFVDGVNKFIVSPNEKVKPYGARRKGMLYITAEKLAPNESFPEGTYKKIR